MDEQQPTNLDLHIEQTRQATILEGLSTDVKDIKGVLIGTDKKDGLVVDVDRLKRSRMLTNAILWFVFTTVAGITGTVIAAWANNWR